MSELSKHKNLLIILAILLLAKFVIVPLNDYQEKLVIENTNIQKRLDKVSDVVANQENIVNSLASVQDLAKTEAKLFYKDSNEAKFKLNAQKKIEDVLKNHNLIVSNFSWQGEQVIDELSIVKYQINIRLDGKLTDVIFALLGLEQLEPLVEIDEFNLPTLEANAEHLGRTRGGRIKVNLYKAAEDENAN